MMTSTAMIFSHRAAPTAGVGSDPWLEPAELEDPEAPPGPLGSEFGIFGAELGILGKADFPLPISPWMPLTGCPQSQS